MVAWGFKSQKKKIWGKKKRGDPPCPRVVIFIGFFSEKTRKVLRIVWNSKKIDRKVFNCFAPPSLDTCAEKIPLVEIALGSNSQKKIRFGWEKKIRGTPPAPGGGQFFSISRHFVFTRSGWWNISVPLILKSCLQLPNFGYVFWGVGGDV